MKLNNYSIFDHLFDAPSKLGRKHDGIDIRRSGIAERRSAHRGNSRHIMRKRAYTLIHGHALYR